MVQRYRECLSVGPMVRAEIGAVVAAAGLSSRMQAFKPMLPLGDSTIIRTLIAGLREAGISVILLVTGHNADRLREHLSGLDIEFADNKDYATTDMLCSAGIGLSFMQEKASRLFFLPGDIPLFSPSSLRLMTKTMDESGSRLVVPACNDRKGHPILIDSRAIPDLLAYRGGMGLKGAIAALGESVEVLEVGDPGILLDADQPEDYRRLLQYAAEIGKPAPPGR